MGGQRQAPAALPPGETRYPLYRRLGGPRAGLDIFFECRGVKFGTDKNISNEYINIYFFALKDSIALNSAVDGKSSVVGCDVLWTGK